MKTMMEHFSACAELVTSHSKLVASMVAEHASLLGGSKAFELVSFIEYMMYDETQQDASVVFDKQKNQEKTRLFVLHPAWGLLLREKERQEMAVENGIVRAPSGSYLFIQGHLPTSVRAGEGTGGEAVAPVLQSVGVTPAQALEFKNVLRIVESDEAGGNRRAEQLLLAQRDSKWCGGTFLCNLHKIHSAAEKTWDLDPVPALVHGLISMALFLKTPGTMKDFRRALRTHLNQADIRMTMEPCDPAATARRYHMLRLFSPPGTAQPRRAALLKFVVDHVLNGDWTLPVLQHHCQDATCCRDKLHLREKLVFYICKITVALPAHVFSRSNWKQWNKGTWLFGFLQAAHSLLAIVFRQAFGGKQGEQAHAPQPHLDNPEPPSLHRPQAAQEPAEEHGHQDRADDAVERKRLERVAHHHAALQMLHDESWFRILFILMQALTPQIELVTRVLNMASVNFEVTELSNMQAENSGRDWRVLRWHSQRDIMFFMKAVARQMVDASLWDLDNVNDTEDLRSTIHRFGFRAAAMVFQMVSVRLQGFPWKLFALMEDNSEQKAEEVLRTPHCMLDPLSRQLLQTYGTTDQLRFDSNFHQTLSALALFVVGTTYDVECMHSRHTRSTRAGTSAVAVENFGLDHAAWVGPDFLLPLPQVHQKKKGGRPIKRKAQVEGASRQPKRKKRRGGGGPWRAFIHHQVSICNQPNNLKALAQQYNNLSEPDLLWYKNLGKTGYKGKRERGIF